MEDTHETQQAIIDQIRSEVPEGDHDQIISRLLAKAILPHDPRKANCHECKFASRVPGSAHFTCYAITDPVAQGLLTVGAIVPTITLGSEDSYVKLPVVKGDIDAGKKGWFFWPMDFDPIWLRWCFLFQQKSYMEEES
jgi:hypothetical protein